MAKINFLALGGLDERHKSMNILEIDSKIFILDAGIYEPIDDNFGIQCFIPNINYLLANADKVKGVFLSSAIYQQIGAIPNLIEHFPNLKIYGSKITLEFLKVFFPGENFQKNLKVLKANKIYHVGGESVQPITLNSSIPGTFGYVFNSKDGNIFYFNNYIFDSLVEYKIPLFKDINHFIGKNNYLFLSDSLNMEIESSIFPNYKISKYIEDYFYHRQRIIVFVYEEDLINIIEILQLVKKFNKKLFIYEKKMAQFLKILMQEKIIPNSELSVLENNQNSEVDFDNSIVILSGNKSQLFKKIEDVIIENDSDDIVFRENDNIFMATNPIPGNEHILQDIINNISRFRSNLILLNENNKFSIHPSQFDLKNYLSLLSPKYFIPIRGYYKDFLLAKNVALSLHYSDKDVIIADNGEVASFENGKFLGITQKIKEVGQLFVETANLAKLQSNIVEERMHLGKNGLVTVGFIVDLESKKIISNVDIQMRGVIFIKNQEYLITAIEEEIIKICETSFIEKWNKSKVIFQISKHISKTLRNKIKKTPIIIVNVKEFKK